MAGWMDHRSVGRRVADNRIRWGRRIWRGRRTLGRRFFIIIRVTTFCVLLFSREQPTFRIYGYFVDIVELAEGIVRFGSDVPSYEWG